jgi:head-tail adaptor|nr:MAG TPA: head tail joining protein [Caudoviricetes sp.]
MLRAGNLTERVNILVPIVERDKFNYQNAVYVNKKTVWANITYQKGAQALTAGEVWMTKSVSVMMRNNDIVNDRCRLGWDGKTYRIESFNRSKADGSIAIVASVIDETNDVEEVG